MKQRSTDQTAMQEFLPTPASQTIKYARNRAELNRSKRLRFIAKWDAAGLNTAKARKTLNICHSIHRIASVCILPLKGK